ncbi:hypothetical protein Acr_25g0002700 [Actinidia rufa]|uniref:Integrase catalytic domain-containing protein n=1 Tax=Actinidia rufa TaxID=165716 RepID=A0A7J0GYL0_9ERIC|nr:hypothetical protein Acr_25g0002700 [Actinidia rufa]
MDRSSTPRQNHRKKYLGFFVWKHVVCRFGIPKVIILDNARQFDNDKFKLFYSDLVICHHFSSLGHPQANGQVEVTNCTILRNLKARLERSKSEWAEELPSILWAYHTTSRIPMGETPYSMVFRMELVIPVEIGMPNFRTSNFDKENNEIELRLNLNLLDEKREMAKLRQIAYKCQVAIIEGSNTDLSSPATWSCERSPYPLWSQMRGNLVLHGKAPTKSSRYLGREPTSWKI